MTQTTLSLPTSVELAPNSRGLSLSTASDEHLEDLMRGILVIHEMTPRMFGDLLLEVEDGLAKSDDEATVRRYFMLCDNIGLNNGLSIQHKSDQSSSMNISSTGNSNSRDILNASCKLGLYLPVSIALIV